MTEQVITHIGTPRHSGRYPWGSGDAPKQRDTDFLGMVAELKKKGLTDREIYEGMGITSTQFRAKKRIASTEKLKADQAQAVKLKATGMSNVAIGTEMGLNESSVRALLNPSRIEKANSLEATAAIIKARVDDKKYVDIGAGNENNMGIADTKLKTAVAMLEEQGYKTHRLKVEQATNPGNFTTYKVMVAPGVTYSELLKNKDQMVTIGDYSTDRGRKFEEVPPLVHASSSRLMVKHVDEGGAIADGVVHLRRGVEDLSIAPARHAQVRIGIDGTHYIKGMAMYSDKMPDGVDMVFHTNKPNKGDKLAALQPIKKDKETDDIDADLPFGSVTRPKIYFDAAGNKKRSPLNIVNDEDNWNEWSRTLSSQMLSKQPQTLAKRQLDLAYLAKQDELGGILALTNPAIKKNLLDTFAESADSSSVHLKAAALPRQRTQVILPINSLKDNEVYAPNFLPGERVVLIRHPHGGVFEIPELTVNNRNPEARRALGSDNRDAIGINVKVARHLSGADFDGDTVLVIPNNSRSVKNASPLDSLKDFDPQEAYPGYPGMKPISKQQAMGDISNLITDMTIKGAPHHEIARAVKHSMVVIDAEKHSLNYKLSAKDQNIKELKEKYQREPGAKGAGGASTIISRAKSPIRVPQRRLARANEGGPIDPATGRKRWVDTGVTYVDRTPDKQGNIREVIKPSMTKLRRLEYEEDAFKLSSGHPIEAVYADHSNRMKALANQARKYSLETPNIKQDPSALKTYRKQHDSLKAKLNLSNQNAPRERQAQLIAAAKVKAKKQANPDMDKAEIKKLNGLAIIQAREKAGALKDKIDITPDEWTAIQAGAISNNMLKNILKNTDVDKVKAFATPREAPVVTGVKLDRAKAMLRAGHSQSEIAVALGIKVSTLNSALSTKTKTTTGVS